MYPFNFKGQMLQSDASSAPVDRGFVAHLIIAAALASPALTTGIHAAVVNSGVQQVITTGITKPSVPRNITATAGGTAADIKAIQVTITGTNFNDEVISEVLPAFTVDTAGTVQGNKAFKTVTSITIPAHDGVGATTSIGFGEKLGIPYKLSHDTVLLAYRNNTKEVTAPTVTVSATVLESNTFDLNSTLNDTQVDLYLIV